MAQNSFDSRSRSIVKALSWRGVAMIITTSIAWVITNDIHFAATIGVVDTLVKLGGYYMHERMWNRIQFGRVKHPEYHI